ncbi:XRE family transcriptional regulator [Acinetobacter radioresistens]|uniref:LexA family transcriptional regulator n=1 Tax=Acinetobacter radioresistens TaxID=40216 RepID=UPI0032B5B04E
MNDLQDRINEAIAHFISQKKLKKLDRKDLAKYCGVSVAAVGQWINGKTNSLDSLTNAKAAQYFGVNPHWLAGDKKYQMLEEDGTNQKLDNNVDISQKIDLIGRPIPVISWVQAGPWTGIDSVPEDTEFDEWLPPNKDCGKNGYALVVKGLSMYPRFEPEDRIYVNPDYPMCDLRTDDLVIVCCPDDVECTFKKLIIEGNQMYLQPLNPEWPEQIMKLPKGCRLVGKVVGQYRKI